MLVYGNENGHYGVPLSEGPLGEWVDTQRQRKRDRELSAYQQKKLGELKGFKWIRSWDENYNELVKFKAEHGHCNVTLQDFINGRLTLTHWVKEERKKKKQYDDGERTNLTPDRIARLDKIGFTWSRSSNSTVPDDDDDGPVDIGGSGHGPGSNVIEAEEAAIVLRSDDGLGSTAEAEETDKVEGQGDEDDVSIVNLLDSSSEDNDDIKSNSDRAERTARQLTAELKDARMDIDAMRDEFENRVSELTTEAEDKEASHAEELKALQASVNEARERADKAESELAESKADVEALEGEASDLQETIQVMEQNMGAVRSDFAGRMDAARDEARIAADEYEGRIDKMREEADGTNKELRKLEDELAESEDKGRKMKDDLEAKTEMLDDKTAEIGFLKDRYERRIDDLTGQINDLKDEQDRELGKILEENDALKKEVEDAHSTKRSAEHRTQRLEEEVEGLKEAVDDAKREVDESKEEYGSILENLMAKVSFVAERVLDRVRAILS